VRQLPGDEPEWKSLVGEQFAAHGRLFFDLAYRVLRDAAGAEDVCQQAMVKALQAEKEIQGRDSLKSWIARVVVTESLQIRRRKGIEKQILQRAAAIPVDKPRPPELELREAVLRAVAELPELARVVVTLRLLHDMKGNQVAELLSVSAVEVSRQLHKGMELLRSSLSDWGTPPGA